MSLKRIIQKAVDGGWDIKSYMQIPEWTDMTVERQVAYMVEACFETDEDSIEEVIFSHSFAKSYFPEGKIYMESATDSRDGMERWQYELQQMVLEEDRVAYLERFL